MAGNRRGAGGGSRGLVQAAPTLHLSVRQPPLLPLLNNGSNSRSLLPTPHAPAQLAERPPSPMGLRRTSRGSLAAGSPGGAAALAAPGFGSPGAQAPLSLGALQQQPRQLTEEQKQQVAREAMREVGGGGGHLTQAGNG